MRYELIDLTGQTFSSWTVLSLYAQSYKRESIWNCRCICGTLRPVLSSKLRRAKSLSCGCMRAENQRTIRRANAEDITSARRAIMERDWPTFRDPHEILADINALPGKPISFDYLRMLARRWGITRPGYRSLRCRELAESRRAKNTTAHTAKPVVVVLPAPAPAPEAPPAGVRSWFYAKPVVVTNAPTSSDVAAWIAANGVKRLPAAAVCQTSATIPDADRVALAEYRAARNAEAAAQNAPRQSRLNRSISAKQSSSLRSRDFLQAKRA